MLVDGKDTRPEGFARATGKDAQMVGVFKVLCKHDIADVKECRQLSD
jgi:hypothetical protein